MLSHHKSSISSSTFYNKNNKLQSNLAFPNTKIDLLNDLLYNMNYQRNKMN